MAPEDRKTAIERPSRRWLAAGVSVGAHAALVLGLLNWREPIASPPQPATTTVILVQDPQRPRDATAGSAAAAAPVKAVVIKAANAPAKTSPDRPAPAAAASPMSQAAAAGSGDVMSGDALGSATAADALPGGECDMARRLQAALRRDALVRAAVTARGLGATTAAILVWNGGWVASPGEDGKGLAAVREAIVWEVAFAPPACRAARVHGAVLFSVSDTRIAVGAGDWRWGDLVSSR